MKLGKGPTTSLDKSQFGVENASQTREVDDDGNFTQPTITNIPSLFFATMFSMLNLCSLATMQLRDGSNP